MWITLLWIIGGMIWALSRGFEESGIYFDQALGLLKKVVIFIASMLLLPFIIIFHREPKPPKSSKDG
jgi:hypothetical protein